ncbi:tetratricopeptide repeat protein [bacterium]|nr:tetratricopeptide repeat protein [bacterium]QQR57666.1 MAG: tetratricopeptide repeat protein [Candidatus Melainabacteria bacterium]
MHSKQRLSFISASLIVLLSVSTVLAQGNKYSTTIDSIRREYQTRHFDKANQMARRLLKRQEMKEGKDSPYLIETLNLVIASACAGKKCSDTTPWLLRLLELRKKVLGPDHPHVAVTLAMLGENAEMKGELLKAKQYFEEALAIRTKVERALVEPTRKNLVRIESKMRQK